MFVKSDRLKDFLWLHRLFPDYEIYGLYHYKNSERLIDLLDKYTIEYSCIPNKKEW